MWYHPIMSTAQHVILFKYNWFRVDSGAAVVGPFESLEAASGALESVAAGGFVDCEAWVLPLASLASVRDELTKRKEEVDAAAAAELARRGGQLTVDQVIARCEALPDLLPVVVACEGSPYDGQTIDGTDSYRGSYDELAIVPSAGPPVVVAHLRDEMRRSLGSCYYGHKGGEYYMSGDTHVWLSEYGESSGLAVVDVRLSADGLRVELACRRTG